MIFCVECGAKPRYADIIKALEELHITYQGQDKENPIAMLFETDAQSFEEVASKAEKAIKGTRYGRMISFRVIPKGSVVYYKK